MSSVPNSDEVRRVLALPRRVWETGAAHVAQQLTLAFRLPGHDKADAHGRCAACGLDAFALNDVQGAYLYDAWAYQGAFGSIGVGEGKTLTSLLLPAILGSARPLLVLPAKLEKKTRIEQAKLAAHWRIPNWTRFLSFEFLGREQNKQVLAEGAHDLIVVDEAQKLKSQKARVTRVIRDHIRLRRGGRPHQGERGLVHQGPIRFCTMSGTPTDHSLKEFEHLTHWTLPDLSPLPRSYPELELWANALDDLTHEWARLDPGALLQFCDERDRGLPELVAARRGFARRFRETPGVIVSSGSARINASLTIEALDGGRPVTSPRIDAAFARLRDAWELPDGTRLELGSEVWRHARQLSLGFFYVWDPRPPQEWLAARAAWGTFAREQMKTGRYDSDYEVGLHFFREPVFQAWSSVRETFERNQATRWICDSVLKRCADWLRKTRRGLCWVEHIAFGRALSSMSGVPYFAEMGLDPSGRSVEEYEGPAIVSIKANSEGRNLQHKWNCNLMTSVLTSALQTEQWLGRTHRQGQLADEVSAEIYVGCIEHVESFWRAKSRAVYQQDMLAQRFKLNYADTVFPTPLDVLQHMRGPRWEKRNKKRN